MDNTKNKGRKCSIFEKIPNPVHKCVELCIAFCQKSQNQIANIFFYQSSWKQPLGSRFRCFPSYRVTRNCPRTFNLLAADPDGDHVKCRAATNRARYECSLCGLLKGFTLNQVKIKPFRCCTLGLDKRPDFTGPRGFIMYNRASWPLPFTNLKHTWCRTPTSALWLFGICFAFAFLVCLWLPLSHGSDPRLGMRIILTDLTTQLQTNHPNYGVQKCSLSVIKCQRLMLYDNVMSVSRRLAPWLSSPTLMDTIPLSSWWKTSPKVKSACPTQIDPTHTSTLFQLEKLNTNHQKSPELLLPPPSILHLLGFIARRFRLSASSHCSFLYGVCFCSFLMSISSKLSRYSPHLKHFSFVSF